jgi:hypothetical protein
MAGTAGQLTKAKREGYKNRLENYDGSGRLGGLRKGIANRMTKEGRKKVYQEKVDRSSGEMGLEKAERRKVNDERKRFKEENLGRDDLQAILNTNDGTHSAHTRQAAAIKLGEDGHLNTQALYDNAQELSTSARGNSVRNNITQQITHRRNIQGRIQSGGENRIAALTQVREMRATEVAELSNDALRDEHVITELQSMYNRNGNRGQQALGELARQGRLPGGALDDLRTADVI